MLDKLRNTKNSLVILVAFAAIILVFIFWGAGPGGDSSDDRNVVATVNGAKIETRQYQALYKRELDYYREAFKGQPLAEIERRLDLKGRAIGILVNREVALQAARDLGMYVSRTEVQEAIMAMEAFKRGGVFNKEQYLDVLASNRVTPADFEKGVEDDLLAARMREKIISDVTVSEDEVKEAYFKINRKIDLDYVTVSPESFIKGVEVTDEEGQAYLAENGSEFMLPSKVRVFYSFAGYDELADVAKVTDEEIMADYEADPEKYMTPAKVRARHILIRPESMDPDKVGEATVEARAKAERVLGELRAGGDFAALARKYSKDPGSAAEGGDLGWFERGVMIKPFEDVAFDLAKGEISDVVETEFGFHIIKLIDKVEALPKPFKEVKSEIREKLAAGKAAEAARKSSLAVASAFREAGTEEDLKKAVSAHAGVKAAVTPLFSYGDEKVELVRNEMLNDVVFSMRAGDVSRLLETPQGIYVIKVLEKVNPRVPEYAVVASKIKALLREKKAYEAAEAKANQIAERLKNGEALSKIAADEKLKVGRTGLFSLADAYVPKVGAFVGERPEMFALTSEAPAYTEPVKHEGKFYLFSYAGSKDADEAGFAEMKDELTTRLLADKQEQAIGDWFEKKRSEAEIRVFDERL